MYDLLEGQIIEFKKKAVIKEFQELFTVLKVGVL